MTTLCSVDGSSSKAQRFTSVTAFSSFESFAEDMG
jgi:hypothetical protein